MQITVLGSGAAYPRPGGACSGFLVSSNGTRVWLDAGNGTFSRLTEHVRFRDIDALVVSHAHADHTADILPLMYALGFDEDPPPPIPVHAPPDVPQSVSHGLGEGSLEYFRGAFAFKQITGTFEVGGLRFEPFRTVHPVETYGFRIREGDALTVYTADTGDFPELPDECRGAELLICESTFVRPDDAPPDIHLWAHQAGTVAQKAEVGALALTHVWPCHTTDEACAGARETFDGPVMAALEGDVHHVG